MPRGRPATRENGNQYTHLRVVERDTTRKARQAYWVCVCDCGKKVSVKGTHLRSGNITNCGCFSLERMRAKKLGTNGVHYAAGSSEYAIWQHAKARCRNPNHASFANYGGRGITFHPAWDDFREFLAHIGPRPSPKHSIDRIDNDRGYEPGNVRWATKSEQQNNQRTNRIVRFAGETMTLAAAIKLTGIKNSTVRNRLHKGWTVERALNEPASRPRASRPG